MNKVMNILVMNNSQLRHNKIIQLNIFLFLFIFLIFIFVILRAAFLIVSMMGIILPKVLVGPLYFILLGLQIDQKHTNTLFNGVFVVIGLFVLFDWVIIGLFL